MARRSPVRLTSGHQPIFDLFSYGRAGPSGRFTPAQIAQIQRTVHRMPEVMVKVTGGGGSVGAVGAHFRYISRKGELTIETDEGERIASREAQKALLKDWHLELTAGQYRAPRDGRTTARRPKLVHNIVLSMPSPTPPEKVLAASRKLAREKFGARHRYVMALHTDQQHPHVHLVVKAESEEGRRLHIDKEMLRGWREDFARLMREQGTAANATPRVVRGRNKGKARDEIYRAQHYGTSTAVYQRVTDVVKHLAATGQYHDALKGKLVLTRKAVVSNWLRVAEALDQQGEIPLAADVRHFTRHLPPARTDSDAVADAFVRHVEASRDKSAAQEGKQNIERTR